MDIGTVLQQRYQLERLLGQGSMGATYQALDLQTRQLVAVKRLHLARLQEWKTLELFEREANILQHLQHPAIPAYIDYFSIDAAANVQFVLVQEYIAGKTLHQLVAEGWRGTETEIINLLKQLVDILSYLHGLRPPVIHRDITPKNILLSPENKLYLVDFGAVQEQMRRTFLGGSTIIGTFGYMPFEQFSGQTVPASDYYAMGATALFLLTHRNPDEFPREHMKIQFQPYLSHVSPNLRRVLEELLEPSPQQRLASPKRFQMLLAKWIPETPPAERRAGSAPSIPAESADSVVPPPRTHLIPTPHAGKPPRLEKPYGTSIRLERNMVQDELHLQVFLPVRTVAREILSISLVMLIIVLQIADLSGMSDSAVFGVLNALIGITGIGVFWAYLWRKGYHIELTPATLKLNKTFLGKAYAQTVVPMATLTSADIQPHMEKITITTQNGQVKIPHNLKRWEIEWLLQELTDYVATHGKKEEPDDRTEMPAMSGHI